MISIDLLASRLNGCTLFLHSLHKVLVGTA